MTVWWEAHWEAVVCCSGRQITPRRLGRSVPIRSALHAFASVHLTATDGEVSTERHTSPYYRLSLAIEALVLPTAHI